MLVGVGPAHPVFTEGTADNGNTVFALKRGENQPSRSGNNSFLWYADRPFVSLAILRGDVLLHILRGLWENAPG
jgi:hypothetical protein